MDEHKKHVDFNLTNIAVDKADEDRYEKPEMSVEDQRHQQMMDMISPFSKKVQQKNTKSVYVDYKTRTTKLILVMCPEWAPEFPPFNLARLSGVCKSAGYETSILDLNVKAYNAHQNIWQPEKLIPFRLWDPSASWHWLGETYMNDIHPLLEPILEEGLQHIIEENPEVVGFSQYYISEEPTKWMCKELKKRAPHIKIAVGGSNVQKDWFDIQPYYDYICTGEGEAAILAILQDQEDGIDRGPMYKITQEEMERININDMPMPDYEGLDFNEYKVPNGVTSEFSRGCTAKCTFCEETHFWKYRQRLAIDVLREAEYLYYEKGADIMWFIDSLINGNINELRAFAIALREKNIKMRWTGYARCDGRMDDDYFKDLAAGGCIMLNYGCESGSQKVLDDMAKGVTIKEMEDNFKSGKKYGVYAATNWIVGFPTEQHHDFARTMTFLWRNRNMNINNVGAGVGMAVGPETIVGQNPHKWNISYHKYQNHWISNDFTIAGIHVMHRVKLFHTFIDFMVGATDVPFGYPVRHNLAREHYVIRLNKPNVYHDIEYEDFDYNIIKPDISPFADSLVNEIWPFLRMMWLTRGGYRCTVDFNPDIDSKEFGSQFGPADQFHGTYKFVIADDGTWKANFKYKYNQVDNPFDDRKPMSEGGRKGPFYAQDYSRMQSNTAKRARKLAKPEWSKTEGRSQTDFGELLEEESFLNKTIDFSFEHNYKGKGKWERGSNNVAVPDVITAGVNADNKHLAQAANFKAIDADMITVKLEE
jgi:anaerobic magnesium-protoporphyrin IX monomethyl ester cyclase